MFNHKLHWRYKNFTFLSLGLLLGIFLYNSQTFHQIILGLGSLSFLGAFVAGLLYDSTFTVSTSIVILLILTEKLPVLLLALIATPGAVIGDYIVFRFVKDGLVKELKPIVNTIEDDVGRKRILYIKHLFHSKYFHWMLPLVAVIMVGSPFPNEIAIGILGAAGIRTRSLLLISLIFNFLGILLIVSGFRLIL